VPRAERRQARRVRGPDRHRARRNRRPRGHRAGGRGLRRSARRARPTGRARLLVGTAQAVLDHAKPGARLVFSTGWHITRDGQDVCSWKLKALVNVVGRLARLVRVVDLDDQVEAARRIFASDTCWTVVRGSSLEEATAKAGPSGAGTSATPSSRATSRAASTLPSSWSTPSRTTISSTRRPPSSAARAHQRSPTPRSERAAA
jgi:hypothetical protein